jgi:hypothetical protein
LGACPRAGAGREHALNERRGPWYLFTGVVIGIALGLLVAWVIYPVEYIDTAPFSLRSDAKEAFRGLVAQAYMADGDLARARSRLILLQDANPLQVLADQAQRMLAKNTAPDEARALAQMAADMQSAPAAVPSEQDVPPTPTAGKPKSKTSPTATLEIGQVVLTPTRAPTKKPTKVATFTPRAPVRASATPGAPFALKDKKKVCDPKLENGLLQVEVRNAAGAPVSGVRVDVTWGGGQDSFFTGLFPLVDAGYADFVMTPGVTYNLRIGEGGELISKLTAPECKNTDDSSFSGGWMLEFNQP